MFRVFWEVFRVLGGVPGFGESGSCFFGSSEMFRDVPVFLEVLHAKQIQRQSRVNQGAEKNSSSLVPLFQNESKCETILLKTSLICVNAELIFIRMVSHLDSF